MLHHKGPFEVGGLLVIPQCNVKTRRNQTVMLVHPRAKLWCINHTRALTSFWWVCFCICLPLKQKNKQTNKQKIGKKKEEKKHRDISSGGRKVSSAQVKILLQSRADPSKESSRGRSAVDFAKEADVFGSHQPVLAAPCFDIYRFFCFLHIDSKNGELFAGLDGSMVSFGGILLRLV